VQAYQQRGLQLALESRLDMLRKMLQSGNWILKGMRQNMMPDIIGNSWKRHGKRLPSRSRISTAYMLHTGKCMRVSYSALNFKPLELRIIQLSNLCQLLSNSIKSISLDVIQLKQPSFRFVAVWSTKIARFCDSPDVSWIGWMMSVHIEYLKLDQCWA
jgi:hypothetical protein